MRLAHAFSINQLHNLRLWFGVHLLLFGFYYYYRTGLTHFSESHYYFLMMSSLFSNAKLYLSIFWGLFIYLFNFLVYYNLSSLGPSFHLESFILRSFTMFYVAK